MSFESDGIEEYGSLVSAVDRGDFRFKPKKLELYFEHHEYFPAKPYIQEDPKLELKALPPHLRYVFLGRDNTLLIIIALDLNVYQ